MFGLGMSEIIFLGILALIVIGPKELPELARTLGRFLNELKRSTNVLGEELKQQARFDLNETIPNPNKKNNEIKEEAPATDEPQQMEFSEQAPQDENKKEEHKPS